MKTGPDLARRRRFIETASGIVRSQMRFIPNSNAFSAPREFWENHGDELCAILRGWTDSELGQAAANAQTGRRRLENAIIDVLGEEWVNSRMNGRDILIHLAAVGIIAELCK
jgi:hypothetical protein